ncbi:MAG: MFS transporter [Candidatus Nitrosocaldus sp.]|nr:MFS transporter [Candidatus Nitrosocaldus sp.]MDW8000446.1 MFS transporter [Candidatus Nitrosocaldus sp.]
MADDDGSCGDRARLKALNLFENSSLGASALFVPILANALTGSYMLVGVIAAGYGVAQALSYAYFGRLADRYGKMGRFVRFGFLASSIAFFAHVLAYDGLTLMLVRLAAGVATGVYAGAMIALSHDRTNNGKLAGIVSFGSLGWLVGTIGAGVMQQLTSSYTFVFLLAGSIFLAGFMVSLGLNRVEAGKKGKDGTSHANASSTSLLHVARKNGRVYASFMLRHVGAAATWSIFPIFLNQELRLNGIELGSVYALNALTQFVFMNTVMKRIGSSVDMNLFIQAGVLLSSVVFLAYYASSTYVHIIPAQILLGIAWSMLYLGSLYILLNRSSDGERASSTALLESAMSISIIIGSLVGGVMAELAGLRAVMLLSSLLCLASFLVALNWRGLGLRNGVGYISARYSMMVKRLRI